VVIQTLYITYPTASNIPPNVVFQDIRDKIIALNRKFRFHLLKQIIHPFLFLDDFHGKWIQLLRKNVNNK
jgi:hypothetical protein